MRRDRAAFAPIAGFALLLFGAAAIAAVGIARGVFLFDAGTGARWIVGVTPGYLGTYPLKPITGAFRLAFSLDRVQDAGALELRAVERAEVLLDGESIYRDAEPGGRARRTIPHGPLAAGQHVLEISVVASAGPPALWLRSDRLPVSTRDGTDWWFRWEGDPGRWKRAPFATDGPAPFPISRQFPHAARALLHALPALVPLFALAFAWDRRGWPRPTPAQLRFGLLAFWCALAANNIAALPAGLGMDVPLHLDYVRAVALEHRIPVATEGGEMMQPPLAYLLFAALYQLFSGWLGAPAVEQALRILPFACGAAQVELAYRAARSVFPDRADLQRVATIIGGLLPINLYLAHAVGNEPVVAVLGGATAVAALHVVERDRPPVPRELLAAGLLLGLALLAKVTALLLAPALLAAVALRSLGPERAISRAAVSVAGVAGIAALVAGWYYARNWILLGTPFLGTWRPEIGDAWWQEPGYRTAAQYVEFGEALAYPVFAAAVGFWDGLYSTFWLDGGLLARPWDPPWNVTPLLASAWLALVPVLALVAGAWRALWRAGSPSREQLALQLAAGTAALYGAAILYLHLTVPFYCISKGTYFAATTSLLAVLAAAGIAELGRARWARAAIHAGLVCWAATVIAAYWV